MWYLILASYHTNMNELIYCMRGKHSKYSFVLTWPLLRKVRSVQQIKLNC